MRVPLVTIALLCCATPVVAQVGGISVMAFTDLNYLATARDVPKGFQEGQLVAHMAAPLTDRLAFFMEISGTASEEGFTPEVERSLLRYELTDAFKLSGGRYHTPISYWNTAYHHGQWLQTSIARPEMLRYGGGAVLPNHLVGVVAEGRFPATPLGAGYAVGAGNGRAHGGDGPYGTGGSEGGSRAFFATGYLRPPALPRLQMGISAYGDDDEQGAAGSRGRISSAHLAWTGEGPELIAEIARVDRRYDADGGHRDVMKVGYLQAAYRLPGEARAFKPYFRAERTRPIGVEGAGDALRFEGLTGGLRVDFAPVAALKAEYRAERVGTGRRYGTMAIQVSAAFSVLRPEPMAAEPHPEHP